MVSQAEKAARFVELHARPTPFIIPNPWDVGTARLLAGLGYEALATTSAGYAFSVGRRNGEVGRGEMLAHIRTIVEATDLPVNADLEGGFGDTLEEVADTYAQAGAIGLAGGSIEDATGRADQPLYEIEEAVARVEAAVSAVRALPVSFVLTARAENFLVGKPDMADVIKRLQAYQEAGADVLYAPGLSTKEQIADIASAVDRPINVVMGLQGVQLSLSELGDLGVRRISVGSALSRTALGAFLRAAREMKNRGTFDFARDAVPMAEITELLAP